LIELVIVVAVMPIIVGAMAAGLLSVISFTPTISNKLSDSGDAQALSVNYTKDVESATMVTAAGASTNPSGCGLGTQLLGLQYPNGQWISYSLITQGVGHAAKQNLFRNDCQTVGGVPTVLSSVIAAHNVVNSTTGSGSPTASITCAATTPPAPPAPSCVGTPPAWSTNWVSTAQVVNVTLGITYVGSTYTQSLVASPAVGASGPGGGSLNTPTYNCGFATAGTGTYASTLCFIDFSALTTHVGTTPCAGGGTQLTDGIKNTPFTISFCLTVSGEPVAPASMPTYSGAFLGNGGFYTAIPGNPALYEQPPNGNISTVTMSNIQLLAGGATATNWNLITGDAESTDGNESITWTAGWVRSPVAPANQLFTLVPDSPTSAIGNACANPTVGSGLTPGNGLTGIGTSTVVCAAANTIPTHTGTPIISAPAPTSLTTVLNGTGPPAGLEAFFVGILLPG
jgi:hypothetical protein